MGFKTVSPILRSGASATELGDLLPVLVGVIPGSAASVIAARSELVGLSGTLKPSVVIAGLVFAVVTRASFPARLKWPQPVDWRRLSCLLRGLAPCSHGDKSVQKPRPGVDG